MALRPYDEVFAQYREAGVLMYRGFTLQQFADQVCAASCAIYPVSSSTLFRAHAHLMHP